MAKDLPRLHERVTVEPSGDGKKPSHGKKTFEGAFWVLLAQSLIAPTGILTIAFLTHALGPGDYGRYALVLTLITWVEMAVLTMLGRTAVKFISSSEEWRPVATTLIQLNLMVGSLAMVALWAMADPLAQMLGEPGLTQLIRLAAIDVPLFIVGQAHVQVLVGLGRFRRRAWIGALRWVARLVLIVLMVHAGLSLSGAVLGTIASSAFVLAVCRLWCRPPIFARSKFELRQLWGYAIPLALSAWSFQLLARLDLLVLKLLGIAVDEVGVYAAALNLSLMPSVIAGTLSPLLLSTVSRLLREGAEQEAKRIGSQGLRGGVLIVPFVMAAAGSATELTGLFFGPDFAAAGPLLAFLLVAALGRFLVIGVVAILTAAGKPIWTAYLMLPPVALAVLSLYLVIPRAGSEGAAVIMAVVWWLTAVAALATLSGFGWPLVRWRSVVHSVVISVVAFAVATLWPAPGLLVLVKLAILAVVVSAAFLLVREFDRDELGAFKSLGQSLFKRESQNHA